MGFGFTNRFGDRGRRRRRGGGGPSGPSVAEIFSLYGGGILDATDGIGFSSDPDVDTWTPIEGAATFGDFLDSVGANNDPELVTLDGVPAVDFDNLAPGETLTSDADPSAFDPLHLAEGSTVLCVSAQRRGQNNVWLGTANLTTDNGVFLNSAPGVLAYAVYGSSGLVYQVATPAATLTLDQLHLVECQQFLGYGVSVRVDDGATARTANVTNAHSAGTATGAMVIGGRADEAVEGDVSHAWIGWTGAGGPLNEEDLAYVRHLLGVRFGEQVTGTYDYPTGDAELVI